MRFIHFLFKFSTPIQRKSVSCTGRI